MPVLSKEQVFEALMELDVAERAEVVKRLIDEENEEVDTRLLPEQEVELRDAVREHRDNPGVVRSWSDIKTELLAKL